MKIALLLLLGLGMTLPALCQVQSQAASSADQDAAYQNQIKVSKMIAAKLFPDIDFPDTKFAKKVAELDAVLKQNQSSLYYYSGKSLILGFEAAGILGYKVHWENAGPDQAAMVISDLSYALICTKDFKKGGAATTVGPGGATSAAGVTTVPLGIQALQPAPDSGEPSK
jgi:hypothetical protein